MPNYQDLLNKLTQLQASPIIPGSTPSLLQRPENQMSDEDTKDKIEVDEMPLPAEIPEDLKINELPTNEEAAPISLKTKTIPSAVSGISNKPVDIKLPDTSNLTDISIAQSPVGKYQDLLNRYKQISTPSENENIEGLKAQQDITDQGMKMATILQGANQIAQGFARRAGGEVGSGEAGVKSIKDQYISQLQNYKDSMAASKALRDEKLKGLDKELAIVNNEYEAGRASAHDKLNLEKTKIDLQRQAELDKILIPQQQANLTKLQQQLKEGEYQLKDLSDDRNPDSIKSTYGRYVALKNLKQQADMNAEMGIITKPEDIPQIPKDASFADLKAMGLVSDKMGADLNSMATLIKAYGTVKGVDLRERKFEWSKEQKDELSDKQVETLKTFKDGQTLVDKIKGLSDKTKQFMGPYASKIEEGSKYIPFTERDPNFVEMQQLVGTELANYVRSISGSAVSEPEAQRLAKNIPSMTDKPNEFMRKLQTYESLLKEYTGNAIDSFKKQGKNPEKFETSQSLGSDPKIDSYAKQHNMTYEQASALLQARGYKVK